jgi:hypothetical protein
VTDHSESGWRTVETFTRFLDFLRSHHNDEEPFSLVLDFYSVHLREDIGKYAGELGIPLVFIPAGMIRLPAFRWVRLCGSEGGAMVKILTIALR